MNKTATGFAIAGCGFATTLAVAMADVIVANETGFDFFTVGAYGGLVPFGAIVCGALAASGYYMGSRAFQQRPNLLVLMQMVLIAALAQFIIYYLEYFIAMKGAVGNWQSFVDYLNYDLTSSVYSVSSRGHHADINVGQMGYVIAALHFAGFMVGAAAVYFGLQRIPVCRDCDKFLDSMARRIKRFSVLDEVEKYHNATRTAPLGSREFADQVRRPDTTSADNAYIIELELFRCPGCQRDTLFQNVSRHYLNRSFPQPEFARRALAPVGTDLLSLMKGHG